MLIPLISSRALEIPLANPGFEEGVAANVPGYRTHTAKEGNAEFRLDDKVAFTGEKSVSILRREPADAATTAIWYTSQKIPAVPGVIYTAEAMARCAGVLGRANLAIRFKDRLGHWSASNAIIHGVPIGGTCDWTRLTVSAKAPGDVRFMEIFLGGMFAGEVWFDALRLHDDRETLTERLRTLQAALNAAGAYGLDTGSEVARLADMTAAAEAFAQGRSGETDFVDALADLTRAAEAVAVPASLLTAEKEMARALGIEKPAYAAAWLSPMRRSFPGGAPFPCDGIREDHTLHVFRGEGESVQVVMAAFSNDLEQVGLTVSALRGAEGTIAADRIDILPVAHVLVESTSPRMGFPHERDFIGWWPDPLVENRPFDVRAGTRQSVFIKVRVPLDARPGSYAGAIAIVPANAHRLDLTLKVEVWPTAVPERTRLKTIMSFHEQRALAVYGYRWDDRLYKQYIDFLLDHRVGLAGLYGIYKPDLMKYCADRGQQAIVAGGYGGHYDPAHPPHGIRTEDADAYIGRLQTYRDELVHRGLESKAYVYGFDERWPPDFPLLNYLFGRVTKETGLPAITTAYDSSYGVSSGLTGVAGWVPKLPRYHPELAAQARTQGIEVWTYLIAWELEQPVIKSRLLGYFIKKHRVDGILYWLINHWSGNGILKPNRVLQTNWRITTPSVIPSSCGLLIYPGENGPLSSLRFENFVDGIEDYDLLLELERRVEEALREPGAFSAADLDRLRQAADIGDGIIVDGVMDYTLDPARVERKRREVAAAFTLMAEKGAK